MKKKKILCLIGALLIMGLSIPVDAATKKSASPTTIAIRKYKKGNYTGCLQDFQNIVRKRPTAIAYYYMAMSYSHAGKRDEAIKCYTKSLALNPSGQLQEYAQAGKNCLENPQQCSVQGNASTMNELDKFIYSKNTTLSAPVREDFQQKHLDTLRNEMNKRDNMDEYDFRNYRDYSNQRSKVPTKEEIKAALEVLQRASYYQQPNTTANYNTESPEIAQVRALLGETQQNSDNSNIEMLPFALAQNKLTEQLQNNSNITPQMLQNMLMNNYNLYK